MPEEVEEPEDEGELHPGGGGAGVERAEPAEEQREARGLGVPLAREAGQGLHHAGALAEALEILAQLAERPANVEVVEPDQRAALPLEADHVAPGEELERAGEAGAEAAGAPGDGRQPAVLSRVEHDEPVVLAEVPGVEQDALGPEEWHAARPFRR